MLASLFVNNLRRLDKLERCSYENYDHKGVVKLRQLFVSSSDELFRNNLYLQMRKSKQLKKFDWKL